MAQRERSTYFVYSMGKDPTVLTLGTMVLGDYANPTLALRKYIHPPLSKQALLDWVSTTKLESDTLDDGSRDRVRVDIDATELFKFDTFWTGKVLEAQSGERREIIDPNEFLASEILPSNSKARRLLKTWVSATQRDLVLELNRLRPPKIWVLTGQYILKNASIKTLESADLGAGIRACRASAGFPLEGGININRRTASAVDMKTYEPLVWAAQWRLLDINYLCTTSNVDAPNVDAPLPLIIEFSGYVSDGHCRGSESTSTNSNNAFSVRVGSHEESNAALSENDDQEELVYMEELEKAIKKVTKYELL